MDEEVWGGYTELQLVGKKGRGNRRGTYSIAGWIGFWIFDVVGCYFGGARIESCEEGFGEGKFGHFCGDVRLQ